MEGKHRQRSASTRQDTQTPVALSKMYQLLGTDDQPLFSVRAIEKVLESVTLDSPMKREIRFVPTEPARTLSPADAFITTRRAMAPTSSLPTPELFVLECPALAAATSADGQI